MVSDDEEYEYKTDNEEEEDKSEDDESEDDESDETSITVQWSQSTDHINTCIELVNECILIKTTLLPKNSVNKLRELTIDRHIELYIKYKSLSWEQIIKTPHTFIESSLADAFTHTCPCCGKSIDYMGDIKCCTTESCRSQWIEHKYYPSFTHEYQLSPLKVEILMNIIHMGLFNDTDEDRVMENFSPYPVGLLNNGGLSYTYIKDSFNDFVSIESIDDICSLKGIHKMREAFYEYDLTTGHMYDTFEWLISSTFTHMIEIKDTVSLFNLWPVKASASFAVFKIYYGDTELMHDVEPQKVFHGTKTQCVHSILKNGLKIYSNTKNQIHGSVWGQGIYTSTSFNESYGYCGVSQHEAWIQSNKRVKVCMFLCDYYHKSYPDDVQLPPTFKIARENGYVMPRYLYVEYT
jgi:hypothetical protein